MSHRPSRILPVIVFSQFAGTSLWFAGNAVIGDLQSRWGLAEDAVGVVTAAVQAGFIAGTLTFAVFMLSDRLSPRLTFFLCSMLGAGANAAIFFLDRQLWGLLALRFATGFFLAGIYPVGMKIASGWYRRDLGRALGYLVGALVLGTAFPHLVRGLGHTLPWETVMLAVSGLAALGGVLMLALVPDGPYLAPGSRFDPTAFATIFRSRDFRASVFGYFGHMWELYAFWAFVPTLLVAHAAYAGGPGLNMSVWAFAVIAAGALGCIAGGIVSERLGSARVAFGQLLASGACCALSPLLFHAPTPVFLAFLLLWGVVVVGDSPQFSALNAHYAPRNLVGSALTIGNCIGFAITVPSILLLTAAVQVVGPQYLFLALVPGPILGLYALLPLLRRALVEN
jgi:MFS family permease